MFSLKQDWLKIPPGSSKMSLYTWAILCHVCMTQMEEKTIAQTHMQEKHTGMLQNKHNFSTPAHAALLQWSRKRWSLMWNINFQVSCSAWLRQVSAMTHLGLINSCKSLICHPAMRLSVSENTVSTRTSTHTCAVTHTHIHTHAHTYARLETGITSIKFPVNESAFSNSSVQHAHAHRLWGEVVDSLIVWLELPVLPAKVII